MDLSKFTLSHDGVKSPSSAWEQIGGLTSYRGVTSALAGIGIPDLGSITVTGAASGLFDSYKSGIWEGLNAKGAPLLMVTQDEAPQPWLTSLGALATLSSSGVKGVIPLAPSSVLADSYKSALATPVELGDSPASWLTSLTEAFAVPMPASALAPSRVLVDRDTVAPAH